MTQQQIAEFMAGHPLECALAAVGVNLLGLVALFALLGWLARRHR